MSKQHFISGIAVGVLLAGAVSAGLQVAFTPSGTQEVVAVPAAPAPPAPPAPPATAAPAAVEGATVLQDLEIVPHEGGVTVTVTGSDGEIRPLGYTAEEDGRHPRFVMTFRGAVNGLGTKRFEVGHPFVESVDVIDKNGSVNVQINGGPDSSFHLTSEGGRHVVEASSRRQHRADRGVAPLAGSHASPATPVARPSEPAAAPAASEAAAVSALKAITHTAEDDRVVVTLSLSNSEIRPLGFSAEGASIEWPKQFMVKLNRTDNAAGSGRFEIGHPLVDNVTVVEKGGALTIKVNSKARPNMRLTGTGTTYQIVVTPG